MKIKQLFKKAFTMMELVIVIAAVAVLAATSVGIYFGVMNSKPDEQSLSIQEQVITLWEGYISDSTKYYDDIENKAFEFCTEYASKKGINVELNYRVLEFDDFVSSIVEANGIKRAYDPSGNAKEAVIIKIDTTYPSFFVSTAYSVLKVNLPQPTEEMLIKEIVKDPFVIESGLLTRYRIDENSKPENFSNFYELSDINVNGEIKRGIRYVRYLVNHADNNSEEVYKPEYIVYGRANRTLNEECEGKYLPDYFSIDVGGMTLNVTTYDLKENKNDVEYFYDPDHFYTYFNESFTHYDSLTNVEVYDKETEKFVTKECPISKFDSQYVVGEQKISYDPYINIGGDGNGEGANGPDHEIDINIPVIEQPSRPDEDDFSPEDLIKVYPIILYFTEEIDINLVDMPNITKILNWLNIKQTSFQFLYFESFQTLNILITNEYFYELLHDITDKNVYIYVCDGAVLDTYLELGETDDGCGFQFIVYHRPEMENGVDIRLDNLYDITGKKELFNSKDPEITLDVNYMNEKNYSSKQSEPYKVTWPEKPTKTVRIAQNGTLKVGTFSKVFIESNCYPTSNNGWKELWTTNDSKPYGYTISEYAEVINDGKIILASNAQARITGIIRSEEPKRDNKGNIIHGDFTGEIIAQDNSVISEPFRITDYIGHKNTFNAFIDRNIFPTEFYYLDSIRCNLKISGSARYVGLITIRDYRDDTSTSITYLGYINLVSSEKYDNDSSKKLYGTIFKLTGSNCEFKKSYDFNTNRSNFEILSGNLSYSYAWVDCLQWFTPGDGLIFEYYSGYGTEKSPAFKLFSTKNTGFKLSNINLIINEGATFTMPSTSFTGGNTGYAELEVLPSSSIQVKAGGTMHLEQNSYIYINNYFGDSSILTEFKNNINRSDYYALDKREDAFRDVLIKRQDELQKVFNTSSTPMFSTLEEIDGKQYHGNVVIDTTPSTYKEEIYETHSGCPYTSKHGGWRHLWMAEIGCEKDVVTSRKELIRVIQSSIYSWNNYKIEAHGNLSNTNGEYVTLNDKYSYEHRCKCSTGGIPDTCPDCRAINNTIKYYSVNIQRKYVNDVAFAYPGHKDNYVFPLKSCRF